MSDFTPYAIKCPNCGTEIDRISSEAYETSLLSYGHGPCLSCGDVVDFAELIDQHNQEGVKVNGSK